MRVSSGYGQLEAATEPSDAPAGHSEDTEHTEGQCDIDATTNYMGSSRMPHLAHGQIRATAHPGCSKRPRQWVGIEHRTIASIMREDLGLRLHANVVGDKSSKVLYINLLHV